jgi:hypothetical protein
MTDQSTEERMSAQVARVIDLDEYRQRRQSPSVMPGIWFAPVWFWVPIPLWRLP